MPGEQKQLYTNGDVYLGEIKEGTRHGAGRYTFANGDVYDGEFREGKIHGMGKLSYVTGNQYVGEWKNEMRHGKGKFHYSCGSDYDGEWKENKRYGEGTLTYANGEVYSGEWKNGMMHGKGKFTYASGDVFEGEWHEHKKDGVGKYTYANGDVYEGTWKENNKSGIGKYTYANGDTLEGEIKDSNKEGTTVKCKREKDFASDDRPKKKHGKAGAKINIYVVYGGLRFKKKYIISSSKAKSSPSLHVGSMQVDSPITGKEISMLVREHIQHPPLNIKYDEKKHEIFTVSAERLFFENDKLPFFECTHLNEDETFIGSLDVTVAIINSQPQDVSSTSQNPFITVKLFKNGFCFRGSYFADVKGKESLLLKTIDVALPLTYQKLVEIYQEIEQERNDCDFHAEEFEICRIDDEVGQCSEGKNPKRLNKCIRLDSSYNRNRPGEICIVALKKDVKDLKEASIAGSGVTSPFIKQQVDVTEGIKNLQTRLKSTKLTNSEPCVTSTKESNDWVLIRNEGSQKRVTLQQLQKLSSLSMKVEIQSMKSGTYPCNSWFELVQYPAPENTIVVMPILSEGIRGNILRFRPQTFLMSSLNIAEDTPFANLPIHE